MSELASPAQLRAQMLRWMLVLVPGTVLLGFLSSALGGSPQSDWFIELAKPSFYPPAVVFPVVWSVLYAAMGAALAMVLVARRARWRWPAVAAFGAQLALNLAWSPLFFGAHRIGWALADIAALALAVVVTLVLFARVRRNAALLLLPYLAWLCFAGLLNWQLLALNPGADGTTAHGAAAVRINIGG